MTIEKMSAIACEVQRLRPCFSSSEIWAVIYAGASSAAECIAILEDARDEYDEGCGA